MKPQPLDVAIVGMAGCYAGARDVRQFWQNILDKVYSVSEASEEWSRGVLDAQSQAPNRIYTAQGGWLHDLAEFDPREFGVMPNAVDGREPDHFLALRNARDALSDAGYLDKPFDHERAGIILGRGNNTNRGAANLLAHGAMLDQMLDIVAKVRPDFSPQDMSALRDGFLKQLPPFNPEMLPGLIPNVTTGVIANRLDLMGPNCIVDAACASSLVALEQAVRELVAGRCDLMLSGGVHAQTPPQSYMIFSQINALARERIRPFQNGANGTLLGEGCGIVALKRLADAERDGDRIYAVIKGIGVASDGKAKGLFAPRKEGQVVALRRAYDSCGIDPRSVGLVEAHATGIALGDRTEVASLREVFGGRDGLPHIALGSVKSMISHAIPASGAASLIKCALALHHKVLPPMLCDEPAPELELERSPFYINNETRPWVHGASTPRRAGVNAFGFGGINAHVILEEYRPAARATQVAVLHAPSESELVLLAAADRDSLIGRVQALRMRMGQPGVPSLAAVARACATQAHGPHRLALVTRDLPTLVKQLDQAVEKLRSSDASFKLRGGVHYGHGAPSGKLCFLFPGEGAQYAGMLGDLAVQFPQVREWFDFLDATATQEGRDARSAAIFPAPTTLTAEQRQMLEARLYEGDTAAESVFAGSMGLFELLDGLGLKPDAMLGHSTGENTALTAARVRRYNSREELAHTIHALNRLYRELDARGAIAEGTLLTLGALRAEQRAQLLATPGDGVRVAMDNCPNQLVLYGPPATMTALAERLAAEGVICQALPFGRAYHTPLFKPVADAYRGYFRTLDFGPGRATLYSARSAAPFPADADAIRALVAEQWENPVRFTDTLHRLYDDGYRVFVEVGPSANLTAFVGDTLRAHSDVLALSTDSRRKSGIGQLQSTLAQLFAAGVPFDAAALYAQRDIVAFDLNLPAPAPVIKPRLSLMMPRLEWPQDLPVPPLPQASTAAAPTANASITAPASNDPRADFLRAHFGLMQDFLDSQARVLGLLGTAATTAPVASAVSAPGGLRHGLLGRIVEQTVDKLVCEHTLRLDRERFLRDHTLGGAPSARDTARHGLAVVPFTFSMEIAAQAATRLLGREDLRVIGLENSRGSRWLALDDGSLALRMVAERAPSRAGIERVAVRLYTPGEGAPAGGLLVFEATVLLADAYPPAPGAYAESQALHAARRNPPGELYAHGMFHGPRLQGVKRLHGWNDTAIDADLETLPAHDYFADSPMPRFEFDAALLDAAGQLAGYWLSEKHDWGFNCFPFRVASLRCYAPAPPAGRTCPCRMQLRFTDEHTLEARFDVLDAQGRVLMRVEGWEDRRFAVPQRLYDYRLQPRTQWLTEAVSLPLPAGQHLRRMRGFEHAFLDEGGSIWKRMLAHLTLSATEIATFNALPANGPRREEWLMGRIAAKEVFRDWARREIQIELANADVEIVSEGSGRPYYRCAALGARALPALSISHSGGDALALLAPAGERIGLDDQRLARVDGDLLEAGAFSAAELTLLGTRSGEDRRRAAVALWCAKEAAAKAQGGGLGGRPHDWIVSDAQLDRRNGTCEASVRHAGQQFSEQYSVTFHFIGDDEILALCTAPTPRAALAATTTLQ